MSISVKKVENNSDLMKFIKLPWRIYRGDKYWVPPLIFERKKILNKQKNPFFKHAEMELFLAIDDGEIIGRIAAIINHNHNKTHNDKVGFFGFFECENNQVAANALFDEAKKWLKAKNCDAIRGPANPSSNDDWGLLFEGFDDSPRILMTYNPKYYKDLIENYGFKKVMDLFAWKVTDKLIIESDKIFRVQELVRKRYKVKTEPLNYKKMKEEIDKVKFIYNKAWEPNWGFVPLTDEEVDALGKDLKPLADPDLSIFALVDDKPVGFVLALPDYNLIFKDMNGRLFPFNWIKLLTRKKKLEWVRILILGIIPEYQKKGLDSVLYYEVIKRGMAKGVKYAEASWVLETNELMNRSAETMNGELYKKYRIYELAI